MQIKYLGWFFIEYGARVAHNSPMLETPTSASETMYRVAVVMQRTALTGRWAAEKWEVKGVVRDDSPGDAAHRVIVRESTLTQYLFTGHVLKLVRDEAEGYYMNVTSPHPKVFVLWRMHDDLARPEFLTVGYNEGMRWADSGENVDGVAMPAELLPWIGAFVEQHYRPEPAKARRYASSRDKGRMGGV